MSIEKSHYIPTLDGLRAVAILVVITSHALPKDMIPWLSGLGHAGVMIFFALSGFLITSRLLDEQSSTGRISFRNFYVRRIFRILPPALVYLGVVALGTAAGVIVCSERAILAALLLYTNYAPITDLSWKVGHFWSLSVEEHFYLFWPFLLLYFGVRKGWRTALVVIASICIWRIFDDRFNILARVTHMPWLEGVGLFRTDLMADTLLWGCVLAFYFRRHGRPSPSHISATLLAVIASALLVLPYEIEIRHVTILVDFVPTLLLGSIITAPRAPIGRFLELAPMRITGKLSYSLYIWQQFFFGGPGSHLPWPLGVIALAAFASASYWLIEQPAIRYGRRFLKRAASRPVPAG